ncbi:unnamed protein product [Cylicocyclus nassatus]|uniref:Spaetzle domain-containing protein n=1 Tax=Cylicocyclus nassatus TaxID=53992 RepID=A0AA36GIW0_CYLNA|nr:unnamed protein product [Cylicocyclus nassatus]
MNRCLRLMTIVTMLKVYIFEVSLAYVLSSNSLPPDTREFLIPIMQKKSLDLELPEPEHVCPTTILKRHTPQFGHMENGSYVEIQQDSEQSFEATFVECTNGHHRPQCHGIDTILYSSECVTLYEWRSAYVRLPSLNADFVPAKIKVPIACQCRLIKKLKPFARRLLTYIA